MNYRASNYGRVLAGFYFPTVDVLSSVATAIVLGVGGALVIHIASRSERCSTTPHLNFFDPAALACTTRSSRQPPR
jgi:hypothetical protein